MVSESRVGQAPATEGAARFGLAPPRRFLLPAILLLLSEDPGYGYGLVARLQDLQFGHVDRPAVYRALAALEQDGLVEAAEPHHSASARRMYAVTPLGERVLRVWMGVIREEHVHLGEVIRRYQGTGRMDAVLSEVESGWIPDAELGWSSVSTTSQWRRHLVHLEGGVDESADDADPLLLPARHGAVSRDDRRYAAAAAAQATSGSAAPEELELSRFVIDPERSAVLVDARSTVGPISFGTIGVEGSLDAALVDGVVRTDVAPSGWLTVDMTALRSGNKLYDAELQRRINSRRFPAARIELRDCSPSAPGSRYRLRGELTFHGISRPAEGTVCVESLSDDRIVISGEQVFDMRDFAVPSPTLLMLRFFPDVRVRLQAEAQCIDA